VAYRADIEIAVKGAQELKRLQNKIRTAADAVNSLNSNLSGIANLLPRSFNNLNKVVGEAAANFNAVALGTKEASEAARDYYQANKTLNNALRERIKLLNDIQTAERGTVLANIKASQASRAASGFGAFSASIDIPTQKSIRRNQEKRAVVEAAAETANQIQKLADRQEEFTTRTNAGAQAAARQTAEFYRLARIAKEVAKINAAAGPAQLLLAPAAPGAPAMSGGARRRITGPVERLGSRSATGRFARTADEAAMAVRFAQALEEQTRPLSQIQALYAGIAGEAAKLQSIKALPDSQMLNASARGIKKLETAEDMLNRERQETVTRLREINRLEESRVRRARKLQERQQYMAGTPVEIPAATRGGLSSRASGAISSALIGGGFPLLFGQGPAAAAGGLLGGAAGGLLGGGFGFALSIVGTAIGDAVTKAEEFDRALTKVNATARGVGNTALDVDKLADSLGIAKDEAIKLLAEFSAFESASSRALLASTFGKGDFKAAFDALEKATKEKDILDAIVASRKILGNIKTGELVKQLKLNGGAKAELALQEAIILAKEEQIIKDKKRIGLQDLLLAGLATAGGGELVDPAIFGKQRAAEQQEEFNRTRKQRQKDLAILLDETQKLFGDIDKLSQQYTDADTKRKKKGNNDVATEQARQAEQLARNQIELDNAIFRNKMRLADEEFAVRQRIASLQGKLAEAQTFGTQRKILALVNEFGNIQADYASDTRRLANDVAIAAQELKAANAMIGAQQAGVVGGRYVQGGIGPRGSNQYGPHFDIKRSDGGFYSRTALDRYVQVNGRPLSSGVTVPGGEFGAPRSYGGHAGRDYAFAPGAAMSLTGGAKWMGSQAGSYGDAAAFMTPDGQVYKVIHGKFEAPGTTIKGQYQIVGAQGDEKVQQENLNAAIAARTKLIELLQQERQLKLQVALAGATEFLRTAQEQTMQLDNEIQKRKIRNRLALEGVAPELIEAEMRVFDILKERDDKLKELNVQLSKLTKVQNLNTISTVKAAIADYDKKLATTRLTEAEKAIVAQLEKKLYLLQGIEAIEKGTPAAVEGAVAAGQAAIQTPQEKIEERIGKLKQEVAELTDIGNIAITVADGIGTAFSQAFQGLISGSMSAKEALARFFQSVADQFLDMAAQIIAKQMTMIILQNTLRAFGGGFGGGTVTGDFMNTQALQGLTPAANGATFANGIAKFASGGIVSSPTLFKFADGGTTRTGLMGEAGPEAIMPLKRGPGGQLGVSNFGGGDVNVVVNVDAKGSSVEGNENEGKQLGRLISAAVQSELVKQQRPGGLLAR